MPVLPLVASRMRMPGLSSPRDSPSSIMLRAMRSFTEPPGLALSSFRKIVALPLGTMRLRRTTGVNPMSW